MASRDFLQTMISHYQKNLYLKFELLEYSEVEKDFVIVDSSIIQERKMPNGISNIGGTISINTEQDVRTIMNVQLVNHNGMNNWGADFDSTKGEFKWWLDKRMNVYLGLELDTTGEIEYIQLGHFIITYFDTNHSLTEFPIINIQGSSKEALYATRRGKFLFATTLKQGAVMTDSIVTLLKGGGEKESRIRIDPQINKTSIKLEDGDGDDISTWHIRDDIILTRDTSDFAHGESSFRFDIGTNETGIFATKQFVFPVDMSLVNSIAMWCRCSCNLPDSGVSLWLFDKSGKYVELPIKELVGHVVKGESIWGVDNWRNMILQIEDLSEFTRVYKMELSINTSRVTEPFSFWIDQIYCAEIKNMLPHDLTYGAGATRWSAIREIADLLDANAYYDEYGNFILEKRKYPKEMNTTEKFEYDAYNVLQPVVTYSDTQERNNLYISGTNQFEEHELSNHINVAGGNTSSTVISMADVELKVDGLHIREKGKTLNSRGKVRAIDQFSQSGTPPTILNGDTNVEEVWFGHQNQEAVMNQYPNGFPHLEQPPISNFAIEKIGDFIYHHNNANPDPVIVYTYEAKNRCLYELRKRLAYAERLNIMSAPYFTLKGNDIIKVKDSLLGLNENYEIISIDMPLNGEAISLTVSKIKNLIIDVPYFDISGLNSNACFYKYDFCALAFPYAWQSNVFNIH